MNKSLYLAAICLAVSTASGFFYYKSSRLPNMIHHYLQAVALENRMQRGLVPVVEDSLQQYIKQTAQRTNSYYTKGQLKEALLGYNYLLEIDPGNSIFLFNKAVLALKLEDEETALELLFMVYNDPQSQLRLKAGWCIALIFASYGDYQKAKPYLKEISDKRGRYFKEAEALLKQYSY